MAWRDRPRTKAERADKLMGSAVSLGEDVDDAIAKCSSSETEGERQTRAAEELDARSLRRSAIPSRTCVGSSTSCETCLSRAGLPPTSQRAAAEGTARGGRPGRGGMPGYGSDWRTFSEN